MCARGKFKYNGFTLAEMLVVLAISTLLLALLGVMFSTATWEVSHSSGRIEIVRAGRQVINNIQRYLISANAPVGLFWTDGSIVDSPVYTPSNDEIYKLPSSGDPNPVNKPPSDRVRFFSSIDLLTTSSSVSAREIQNNAIYYAYEITTIPGKDDLGQDVVVRRLSPQPAGSANPLPVNIDTTIKPITIGHRIGIPDSTAPGGYKDGLVVRKFNHESAIKIEVNVSSDLISDAYQRNTIEARTPLRIRMETIFQPPFYYLNQE